MKRKEVTPPASGNTWVYVGTEQKLGGCPGTDNYMDNFELAVSVEVDNVSSKICASNLNAFPLSLSSLSSPPLLRVISESRRSGNRKIQGLATGALLHRPVAAAWLGVEGRPGPFRAAPPTAPGEHLEGAEPTTEHGTLQASPWSWAGCQL